MPIASRTWKGRRLLALDGGGPCGMSTIILMEELMRRVQHELGLSELPRPGEVFDLMAGSGTGGLLAIMWGRLMMTIDESKKYFNSIGEEAFSEKKRAAKSNTIFKASKLEEVTRKMLAEHLGDENARMNDLQSSTQACKTFVCITSTDTMRAGMSVLLRSYPAISNSGPDCSIIEAVHATCSSVGLLKPVEIPELGGIKRSYVDGGIGNNNPTPHLLQEAGLVFPGQDVACIISLGTGRTPTISVPDSRSSQSLWSSELSTMLMALATDCERTAENMEGRFQNIPGVYFRFNVDHGLDDVSLADWRKRAVAHAHAHAYLGLINNKAKMDRAVQALGKDESKVPVERVAGSIPAAVVNRSLKKCPPPSRFFVGREEPLAQMYRCFFSDHPTEQLLFILHGLGGSGKSQIARKFVELYKDRFDGVICVDATSEKTIETDLTTLAISKKAGETPADGLAWLAERPQNWLLVFDNADNISLNLPRFFPSCPHGNIIVTTRNRRMITRVPEEAHCKISELSREDALQLLLKVSQAKGEVQVTGTALVKKLGHFALAIVQAASYIRAHECSIQQYQEMYEGSRGSLLEEYEDHTPKVDDYERTAYATWRACYGCLSPAASRLFNVLAFMHHSNISEDIFRRSVSSNGSCSFLEVVSMLPRPMALIADILENFVEDGTWSRRSFHKYVGELRMYSLVDFDPLTQHYSIHPLFQQWAKTLAPDAEVMYQSVAVLLMCSWLSSTSDVNYACTITPHLDALPETFKRNLPFDVIFARIYLAAGRYKEAEILQQENLTFSKARFGDRNPMTLQSEQQLAKIYSAQGRWVEVVQTRQRLVEINRELFGDDQIGTIRAKGELAFAYTQQGRWLDAEPIQTEVLQCYTNKLGAADPETCVARSSLVMIYLHQGRLEDAGRISREVRQDEILEDEGLENLRLHHFPKIMICAEQGKWSEAAKLQEEVVELSRRLHGATHEKTLGVQKSLVAILLNIPQRLADAEVLAKQVVDGCRRIFGEEHPETLTVKHRLAVILGRRNSTQAGVLLQEVLRVKEHRLGATHPETLSARLDLSVILVRQKRLSEARALLHLTEELQQALSGHPRLYLEFL
ncbi:hypothetical protein FRC07_006088, partial [Ceratobasidium sp. 392]